MTAIKFVTTRGLKEIHGTYEGDLDHAADVGADAIYAEREEGGTYTHWDDASRSTYRVTGREMAMLGAALLSGHSLADTYSVWCAGCDAEGVES